jgi:hypothetical protein
MTWGIIVLMLRPMHSCYSYPLILQACLLTKLIIIGFLRFRVTIMRPLSDIKLALSVQASLLAVIILFIFINSLTYSASLNTTDLLNVAICKYSLISLTFYFLDNMSYVPYRSFSPTEISNPLWNIPFISLLLDKLYQNDNILFETFSIYLSNLIIS